MEIGKDVGFERIRRITGYLVGDMGRWNDAKRAEENDRVIHEMGGNIYEETDSCRIER